MGKWILLQDNPVTNNKKVILVIFPSGTAPLPSLPHHRKEAKTGTVQARMRSHRQQGTAQDIAETDNRILWKNYHKIQRTVLFNILK